MRIQRPFRPLTWALLLLSALAGRNGAAGAGPPLPPPRTSAPAPLRVLQIGDSNTEIGNITTPLAALLAQQWGAPCGGFRSFQVRDAGGPAGYRVQCDSAWAQTDMRNDYQPLPPPYFSPAGLSIASRTAGATVTVSFVGTGLDVYYLRSPNGGTFAVGADGRAEATVPEQAAGAATGKFSCAGLPNGPHQVRLRVLAGPVTLLGADVVAERRTARRGPALHQWGNGWASSQEFVAIDSAVFRTALQALNPDQVVILLGTNDCGLDHRTPEAFQANLTTLAARVRAALPQARVLLVSTFYTKGDGPGGLLSQYQARSFPQAAAAARCAYWDLAAWFGPYDPKRIQDNVHVNAEYGPLIARELLAQLKKSY